MKYLFLILLYLTPVICIAQLNITIHNSAGISGKYVVPDKTNKKHYLGLGDNPIFLNIKKEGTYRVSHQVEYSVVIMDEGPHLDLTDWKHASSEWYILKNEKLKFLLPKTIKRSPFPKTSNEELVKEALKQGKKEWADIAKKCKTLNEYPCSISPSLLKFKIEQKIESKWVEIGILKLIPAMGC